MEGQTSGGRRSAWSKVFMPRAFMLGVFGLLCLLVSTIIDQGIALQNVAQGGEKSADLLWYANPETLATVIRELGIAAFIALAVGALIDRTARLEQQSHADATLQEALAAVTNNMFQAAFGLRTPETIVRHVVDTILSAPTVRTNMHLTLKLSHIPDELIAKHDLRRGKFRFLSMTCRSEIQNVTSTKLQWPIKINIPVNAYARDVACVTSLVIGDQVVPDAELAAGSSHVTDTGYERQYFFETPIEPLDTLAVVVSCQMIKGFADSDLWQSVNSTQNARFTIEMNCDDVEWDLEPAFLGELLLSGSDDQRVRRNFGRSHFTATAPILPSQGVIFWWRPTKIE